MLLRACQASPLKHWFLSAMLVCCCLAAYSQSYTIHLEAVDTAPGLSLSDFLSPPQKKVDASTAFNFVQSIVPRLQEAGFLSASVDSISIQPDAYRVYVFIGQSYRWANVSFDSIPPAVFSQARISTSGWSGQPLKPKQLSSVSEKIVRWAENNGYPFAQVWMEAATIDSAGGVSGKLMLQKGPQQKIDSIAIHSQVRVSRNYLLRYLDLRQGEPYNEEKLRAITNRLREIPFLQEAEPWNIEFKLSGTTLNLYLRERKANQLNGIVGLLPNSVETGKFLLTVDALFAFQNLLAQGESISVTYQNLQYKSPRFKANVVYPYLFNTSIGVDAQFDLFKKDTAFRRTSFQAGVRYQFTSADYFRVFFQHQSNRLITVDTSYVRANKRLPEDVDVSANGGGVEVGLNRTDYRLNPRRGFVTRLTTSALIRQVRKSDAVTGLTDASGFDYEALYDTILQRRNQYFLNGHAAVFFPLGRKLVFRPAYDGGWVSGSNLFRNELYQIGGFRLLRGFDEQSIFTNHYHVLSLELRLLLSQNSYAYLFSDNGYVETNFAGFSGSDIYNGFGVGTTLQTGSGIFTISYALGQNTNNPLQFRQSRIHFGYVAYF